MEIKDKEFLLKLADLLEEYRANIYYPHMDYTHMDNGLHITIDNRKIYVGFLDDDNPQDELRNAANS